jgi:hypothetical protein
VIGLGVRFNGLGAFVALGFIPMAFVAWDLFRSIEYQEKMNG